MDSNSKMQNSNWQRIKKSLGPGLLMAAAANWRISFSTVYTRRGHLWVCAGLGRSTGQLF